MSPWGPRAARPGRAQRLEPEPDQVERAGKPYRSNEGLGRPQHAGALLAQGGLVVLGLVFLAEELYQTAVLTLIIRSGERATARARAHSPPSATTSRR
jgi:hypothetical protein